MNTTARADESDGGADAIADDGTADESSMNTTARADESDGGADAIARWREPMRATAEPTRHEIGTES